jgi:hypothetical protein
MVGKRLVDFLGERIREITNQSKAQNTRTSVTVNVSQFHAPGGGDEVYQELSIHITICPVLSVWTDPIGSSRFIPILTTL